MRNCLQFSSALIIRPNIMKYFTMKKKEEIVTLHEMVPTEHLVQMLDK